MGESQQRRGLRKGQVGSRGAHVIQTNQRTFVAVRHQERGVADGVDQARNAVRPLRDAGDRVGGERRSLAAARFSPAKPNVLLNFGGSQTVDVEAQRDSLLELPEVLAV